ncbi:MAG TPA: exodeoxyribonuclease VII large subunit [Rhodanobacteraceae bacterium]|nr:exodeoxyribonuclease VII large subunit [Rhodanobacteraceae bacterium]
MPTVEPARDVFSPSALNRLVRDLLDDALPALWVEGEISNFARPASGHLYFSLKDANAQIRCALFRPKSTALRFAPQNGMQVLLRGRVSLYEPRGDYQLIVEQMEPAGEGALQREFERLKRVLAAEGLFDAARKRALPRLPRRIGILSSPTGAAVRDVLTVLRRRFPLARVELLPVPVQGKEAPAAIRDMLARAVRAARHDVLLITRGGGSLEDLWAFNDEALARTIAACPIPVVSAVGHEIDFSLTDLVADLRAATPSVAAELLVPDRAELDQWLTTQARQLTSRMTRQLQGHAQQLDHLQARLQAQRPQVRLTRGRERLQALRARLLRMQLWAILQQRLEAIGTRLRHSGVTARLPALRQALERLHPRLLLAVRARLQAQQTRIELLARTLHAISPLGTLQRGYAILFDADGRAIRLATAIQPGATVTARLCDGSVILRRPAPPADA